MLETIKKFFDQNMSSGKPDDIDHQLKLATAALLVEMMQQDHYVNEEERQAVKQALQGKFDLDDDETDELFKLAQQEADVATDYHQFTSLIARQYTQPQKIKMIEYLWTIAYADHHLDPLEEHMIRRIADLIYVSHKDFIKTKHKIQKSVNSE
jgi:uncharacterized tellurite resistance protein B-like protein